MSLPTIARVRRQYQQPVVADVRAATMAAIESSRLATRLAPGARVAITAGSRGISQIGAIVGAAATAVRRLGFEPFVVAAMGSHGGGTAPEQAALLAELGVTEVTAGCPIRSSMETVELGTNSFGLPIHFDRHAYEADGIIVLNRIKPHTSFTGRFESGLLKMIAIGLGKRQGAAQVHKLGLPGLLKLVPEVARSCSKKRGWRWVWPSSKTRAKKPPGSWPSSPKRFSRLSPSCSMRPEH